jgi:hypothetical protein
VGGVFSSLIVNERCRFGVPDGGVLIGANAMGVFQQYSEETGGVDVDGVVLTKKWPLLWYECTVRMEPNPGGVRGGGV